MTSRALIVAMLPLLLLGCGISDQLDRRYYNKRVAPHMLSIANMSQPMLGEHWWIRTKYSGKGWI